MANSRLVQALPWCCLLVDGKLQRMKILFWNIGYAPGLDGSLRDYVRNGKYVLNTPVIRQKRVLDTIAQVIAEAEPDVALCAEVSLGAKRNESFNQHNYLAAQLSGLKAHGAVSKYRSVTTEKLPLHAGNANGYFSWRDCTVHEVHFAAGRKSLVYILELTTLKVIMVHLSLRRSVRQQQFVELATLINTMPGPVLLCGDMNIFGGLEELQELQQLTGLELPANVPLTYPAFNPRLSLDLCLVKGCGEVRVTALGTSASDHAPIIIELPNTL